MATFEEMRARIADDLNRTDLTSQIQKAINRAIKFYEKERFWFNENTWSFSASSATEDVPFSSANTTDVKEIDVVTVTRNSTDTYPIDEITFQELRRIATTGTSHTGPPVQFAKFQNKWFFYPVPDQNYVVHVYGRKSYTTLSASADTNDFTVEAEDLIEARARWWIYEHILKNESLANRAKSAEAEALSALSEKTTALISTGRLSPG